MDGGEQPVNADAPQEPRIDSIKDRDALLAIVAGLWAAVAVSISATDMINKQKNAVIQGCLDGHVIETSHRLAILNDDWRGAVAGNIIVAALFAYLLVILCRELPARFRNFSYLCAFACVVYGASWAFTGFGDYRTMTNALDAPDAHALAERHCGQQTG